MRFSRIVVLLLTIASGTSLLGGGCGLNARQLQKGVTDGVSAAISDVLSAVVNAAIVDRITPAQ